MPAEDDSLIVGNEEALTVVVMPRGESVVGGALSLLVAFDTTTYVVPNVVVAFVIDPGRVVATIGVDVDCCCFVVFVAVVFMLEIICDSVVVSFASTTDNNIEPPRSEL